MSSRNQEYITRPSWDIRKWLIALVVLTSSCTPTIYFLGDTHQRTARIDLFYDEKDVKEEYQTIGMMTHDKFINYDVEIIKKSMIEKAKEKGGDGIIFTDTNVMSQVGGTGPRLSISKSNKI